MQRCMTLFSPQGPCSLVGRYMKKTNIMNNVVGAGLGECEGLGTGILATYTVYL